MRDSKPINLFYGEPDADRWIRFDRYPRRALRALLGRSSRVGGQRRVFLNLQAGLDRLGIEYRSNDFRYIKKHPEEVAGIIGKAHMLDVFPWKNSILFGASVFSHPLDDEKLLERLPVKKVLVPGEWNRKMFEPYYGDKVFIWPVGIDTELWQPSLPSAKDIDFLIYDKVHWDRDHLEKELIEPIRQKLRQAKLRLAEIRYGHYHEDEFLELLRRAKAMVFLCEHETQGIAYQQALSCGVPLLAWDPGGVWRDPSYYPDKVIFGPVTSVPYWDERCGVKFLSAADFPARLEELMDKLSSNALSPRDYILDNLTLEACAEQYVAFYRELER